MDTIVILITLFYGKTIFILINHRKPYENHRKSHSYIFYVISFHVTTIEIHGKSHRKPFFMFSMLLTIENPLEITHLNSCYQLPWHFHPRRTAAPWPSGPSFSGPLSTKRRRAEQHVAGAASAQDHGELSGKMVRWWWFDACLMVKWWWFDG